MEFPGATGAPVLRAERCPAGEPGTAPDAPAYPPLNPAGGVPWWAGIPIARGGALFLALAGTTETQHGSALLGSPCRLLARIDALQHLLEEPTAKRTVGGCWSGVQHYLSAIGRLWSSPFSRFRRLALDGRCAADQHPPTSRSASDLGTRGGTWLLTRSRGEGKPSHVLTKRKTFCSPFRSFRRMQSGNKCEIGQVQS